MLAVTKSYLSRLQAIFFIVSIKIQKVSKKYSLDHLSRFNRSSLMGAALSFQGPASIHFRLYLL
jgi:hypothetical protein